MGYRAWLPAALALGVVAVPGAARASVVVFNFNTIVTGDPPGGTNIGTMTISDIGANMVNVVLSHNATSAAGQFISNVWFNVDPYVTLTQTDRAPTNKFDGALGQGLDTEQNAGLKFDARQGFETSNSGGGANRLKPGESISFKLSGTGLDALDFLSPAVPTGGQRGDVLAMIHVQGIPGGDSVKLGALVPEPTTVAVLALGAIGLVRRRRWKA